MTKSGFDLDEIERRARAFLFQECQPDRGDVFSWMDDRMADFIRYALHNSAPAMIAEIRELRAENARLKGHWSALDKALADNIIETDQPHRVRWEGEWHYGPLADAYFAMTSVVRKLARAALGEPQ